MSALAVRVVSDWHEALNGGDADRLVELSHPDVEVGGPRGNGQSARLLREWVDRANVRLEPGRFFHRADTVVVEERAQWRSPETGVLVGSGTVGSVFVVRGGQVARVTRHDDLSGALEAACLDGSHETGTI